MDELIAGVRDMPTWAQVGLSLFGLALVVMMVEPRVARRRVAAALARLATAFGAATTRRDAFTEWFTVTIEGRPFEVRREYRMRGRAGSYRGPTGHLLVTSTPLAGSRWQAHQVDIAAGRVPSLFGARPHATDDAAFDERFVVMQDGVPVREQWLDAPTRAAVTALFDTPGVTGPVWVQGQHLQVLRPERWSALDATGLTGMLRAQAALAMALERTAGWRGPAA